MLSVSHGQRARSTASRGLPGANLRITRTKTTGTNTSHQGNATHTQHATTQQAEFKFNNDEINKGERERQGRATVLTEPRRRRAQVSARKKLQGPLPPPLPSPPPATQVAAPRSSQGVAHWLQEDRATPPSDAASSPSLQRKFGGHLLHSDSGVPSPNLHCSVASAATAPPSASLRRLHHMLAPRDAATPHMGSEPNSPSGAHMGAAGRLWHCDWTTALPLAVALERRPPSMISVASSCLTCDSPWGFELLVVWPCRDAPSMLLLKTSNARVGVQHAQAPGNSQASKGCAVP